MSFFGKIKSAVMGNPVTREYEIGKHVASAGPGLLWKVYNGIKKSTRQVATTWMGIGWHGVVSNEHSESRV